MITAYIELMCYKCTENVLVPDSESLHYCIITTTNSVSHCQLEANTLTNSYSYSDMSARRQFL